MNRKQKLVVFLLLLIFFEAGVVLTKSQQVPCAAPSPTQLEQEAGITRWRSA